MTYQRKFLSAKGLHDTVRKCFAQIKLPKLRQDYHPMLGAALVDPDHKIVIPFAPESIVKGDGFTKNDCEQNAAKRLLKDIRREHPHLKILIVQDLFLQHTRSNKKIEGSMLD